MILGKSRCKRFGILLDEVEDRPLSAEESAFMEIHRLQCGNCESLVRSSMGLNMLRQSSLAPVVDQTFDGRVIRRLKLQGQRATFNYWSPAIVSAAIAGLALLSAIQMISRPDQMPSFNGIGEARRTADPVFPELRNFTRANREP